MLYRLTKFLNSTVCSYLFKNDDSILLYFYEIYKIKIILKHKNIDAKRNIFHPSEL